MIHDTNGAELAGWEIQTRWAHWKLRAFAILTCALLIAWGVS